MAASSSNANPASALGNGVVRPFMRDGRGDFAVKSGVELVQAAVGQILGTVASSDFTQGELPWRPEFGSLLYLLRHSPNTPALDEIARTYVIDALNTWEPRVQVTDVEIGRNPKLADGQFTLVIRVRFNFVDQTSGGVILSDLESTIGV